MDPVGSEGLSSPLLARKASFADELPDEIISSFAPERFCCAEGLFLSMPLWAPRQDPDHSRDQTLPLHGSVIPARELRALNGTIIAVSGKRCCCSSDTDGLTSIEVVPASARSLNMLSNGLLAVAVGHSAFASLLDGCTTGYATGHHSFAMSRSFKYQMLAELVSFR